MNGIIEIDIQMAEIEEMLGEEFWLIFSDILFDQRRKVEVRISKDEEFSPIVPFDLLKIFVEKNQRHRTREIRQRGKIVEDRQRFRQILQEKRDRCRMRSASVTRSKTIDRLFDERTFFKENRRKSPVNSTL